MLRMVVALIIGVGIGGWFFTPRAIWDYEEKELMNLNRMMSKDKSERLVMLVLTQEGAYTIRHYDDNKYDFQYRWLLKDTSNAQQ